MTPNKKILSILSFLGVLIGLLTLNIVFLKISKSVVKLSKNSNNKDLLKNEEKNIKTGKSFFIL